MKTVNVRVKDGTEIKDGHEVAKWNLGQRLWFTMDDPIADVISEFLKQYGTLVIRAYEYTPNGYKVTTPNGKKQVFHVLTGVHAAIYHMIDLIGLRRSAKEGGITEPMRDAAMLDIIESKDLDLILEFAKSKRGTKQMCKEFLNAHYMAMQDGLTTNTD